MDQELTIDYLLATLHATSVLVEDGGVADNFIRTALEGFDIPRREAACNAVNESADPKCVALRVAVLTAAQEILEAFEKLITGG